MNERQVDSNEQAAANAFSRQAAVFDAYDAGNAIIRYKRGRVRQTVMQCLASSPSASILELNAGTGVDAVYFAGQGYRIHATDIAHGMLKELDKKVNALGPDARARITHELCSYTQLQDLQEKGPYDLIFSNFAGLNCTNELDKVLRSFPGLLKPGGYAVLVVLPSFCLWETLLLFKGKFRTAFRRWFSGSTGVLSRVEGEYFRCWYYPPSYIDRVLGDGFERKGLEGLCTLVPPSYIEGFAERHPSLYRFLQKEENRWKANWPWRVIGDYYIITMQRKG